MMDMCIYTYTYSRLCRESQLYTCGWIYKVRVYMKVK